MKLGSAPKNCFQAVPHELHMTMRDVFGTRMDGMRYPSRQVGQKMSIGMAPAALRSWTLFSLTAGMCKTKGVQKVQSEVF